MLTIYTNEILRTVKEAIRGSKYLITEEKTSNNVPLRRLLRPEKIYYRNGRYYVQAFDYLKANNINENINSLRIIKIKDSYYTEQLPKFDFEGPKLKISFITKELLKNLFEKIGKGKSIYIKYEDFYNRITSRTLKDYTIMDAHKEKNALGEMVDVDYLKAFCYLRGDIRYFRMDRIIELKVLDLTDPKK